MFHHTTNHRHSAVDKIGIPETSDLFRHCSNQAYRVSQIEMVGNLIMNLLKIRLMIPNDVITFPFESELEAMVPCQFQKLCQEVHIESCSGFFYNRQSHNCYLVSSRSTEKLHLLCHGNDTEYYQRNRCARMSSQFFNSVLL